MKRGVGSRHLQAMVKSLDFNLVAKGKALSKQVLYYDFRETTQTAMWSIESRRGAGNQVGECCLSPDEV